MGVALADFERLCSSQREKRGGGRVEQKAYFLLQSIICEFRVDPALNFVVLIRQFLYHGLRDRDPCAKGSMSESLLGHSREFVH